MRVVGGFRPRHALNRPVPETLRMARDLFLGDIRSEGGCGSGHTGYESKEESDKRAAHDRPAGILELFQRGPERAHFLGDDRLPFLFGVAQDLADAEKPHDDRYEADAVHQLHGAESEAWHALRRIHANRT